MVNTLNEVVIVMDSKSENEAFARIAVSGFAAILDPTLAELNEIKTAVSEAVTNSIIHGYSEDNNGKVTIKLSIEADSTLVVEVSDDGLGIDDVEMARQPLYTSKPDMERSGMGFTVMETFMDSVVVTSKAGEGTKICMTKKLGQTGDA